MSDNRYDRDEWPPYPAEDQQPSDSFPEQPQSWPPADPQSGASYLSPARPDGEPRDVPALQPEQPQMHRVSQGMQMPDGSPLPPGRARAPTRPLNRPAGVTRPKTGKPRPKARHRWRRITLITVLVVLVLGGVLSVGGYFGLYLPAKQLAADGAKHLQNAQGLVQQLTTRPLDQKLLTKTRTEFIAAEQDFQDVNTRLTIAGPFLGLIGLFSGRGDEITSYVHLAHMALDLSTAGHKAIDALLLLIQKEQNVFQDPGSTGSAASFGPAALAAQPNGAQAPNGLTMGDITGIQQTTSDVVALVENAWQESQGVTLSALPGGSSIQSAVTLFRNDYPSIHDLLASFQGTMQVAPELFGVGNTTTYLAELLDTSERQGAGGFITAYGTLGMKKGQLASLSLNDTYLLDIPYQASHTTPLPSEDAWYPLTTNWGLRDANLEPDFPTAAKAAEQLYTAEGGSSEVDGVIAFTPAFFEHVLTITGPVQIPDLNDVVDETNLVDRLHFYQFKRSEGDTVPASELNAPNGQFPALLSKYVLAKLRQQSPAASLAILQEVVVSQGTKDIQIYLNNSRAEQSLLKAHKAGAVESPTGDGLFVVDTDISGNKASSNIDEVQQDNVILDDQGNAIHHLVIVFHWVRSAPVYGSSTYSDYIRVYVPSNSQLQSYTGFANFATSKAYGRTVWSGTFQLVYSQKVLLTLTYQVPHAVQDQHGQLHYAVLAQRQASDPLSRLALTVVLPNSGTLLEHSGNLHLSSNSAGTLAIDQLLDRDTTLTTDYS